MGNGKCFWEMTAEEQGERLKTIGLRVKEESFSQGLPISYKPAHLNLPDGQMVEEYPDGKRLLVDVSGKTKKTMGALVCVPICDTDSGIA